MLRIAGFTTVPHIEMIARIRDAITLSGGYILDSHMFSNAMLGVNFEVRQDTIGTLLSALEAAGLRLSRESDVPLNSVADVSPEQQDPMLPGLLNVNFVHDDPPLRIEVPAVPG